MASATGGNVEAFIPPFPPTGTKYQVSNGGGRAPVWSPDGKQLFFHNLGPNRIFVVDVNAGRGLTFGTPVPLLIDGTVHPQAQRDPTRRVAVQINVVLNWLEELKARAPQR